MGGVHQNARTFGHAYRTVPTLPGGGNARSTIHQISHFAALFFPPGDHGEMRSAGPTEFDGHGAPGATGTVTAHEADEPASGGRHPLPSRERFAIWLSSVGFANGMQAVVYDRNGANYCGRLWWMLKWAGHDAVAVLDGVLQAWQAGGGAVASGAEPARFQSNFELRPPLRQLASAADVLAALQQPGQTLIDARGAPRYRGEVEPLDPVAGHIPGALNRPFGDNIGADGRFKPADVLRAEFEALLAGRNASTVVHQCGSGVSALPNMLAMELAGLGKTTLFAGSWSEWCSDPSDRKSVV